MDKIEKVLRILEEEIVPAEGCTEPIAIAYAAAKAKKILGAIPNKVDIFLSGNIIKNVKSVTIPNSNGMIGIEVAVAMGIIAGNSDKELMVISEVSPEQLKQVENYLEKKIIKTHVFPGDIKLYIRLEIESNEDKVVLEIKHTHTNLTKIEKNGEVLLNQVCNDGDFNSSLTDRKILSVKYIYDLTRVIDIDLVKPIFKKVISYNSAIAEEGLTGKYGVNIGKMILNNIEKGVYGNDIRNKAASYASAGSDARMSGCALPVMTTSGSGNQGMTASLPIIKFAAEKDLSEEELIRGLFMSHLMTIHVKTNVGRLSAYCGAICASAGVAASLTYLHGGSYEMVCDAITNILGNLSGVICDGAKASCAMKITSGIYSAFDATMLALQRDALKAKDGIVGEDIEKTIINVGNLAQAGMKGTDEVILKIMTEE
ncbi:L-cysteine desulfidase family protein [Fusobacterium gastrosuis]|uniref:L-cysteine desulfidase family protein n=3 Tax=Fusobacterium gastrosuis TaxID=1755100 RepID=UPI0029796F5A|nr:L-serine ammonia-lyase, iron-sulfur-dependent, subunit alpha [Fusobacteriaceae bacterium]MDY5714058.1 L-serine ammonia-lyase, iron-sulfur-dependent, subunit alpha [Fusobacterium gastrosuis]MDY5795014.1 L-serine ammonia-lyase, iron-sulfur-dependent, subunit alpha [Fusobacterium gastrosuis]